MGVNQPQSFSRKDSYILLRGLLPEISIDSSEKEMRDEIVSLLHNSKEFDLSQFTHSDFEFIDVSGKQAVIPVCREGQEFNGRSVKQIAGSGSVYIRLTKQLPPRALGLSDDLDFEPSMTQKKTYVIDSDSSCELPSFKDTIGILPSHVVTITNSLPLGNEVGSSLITGPPLEGPSCDTTQGFIQDFRLRGGNCYIRA